jgi:hypothetical protein
MKVIASSPLRGISIPLSLPLPPVCRSPLGAPAALPVGSFLTVVPVSSMSTPEIVTPNGRSGGVGLGLGLGLAVAAGSVVPDGSLPVPAALPPEPPWPPPPVPVAEPAAFGSPVPLPGEGVVLVGCGGGSPTVTSTASVPTQYVAQRCVEPPLPVTVTRAW